MGCSASKSVAHPTRTSEYFSSASAPQSATSSPAVGRAFSLPTPLVHHPPVKKGDTNHLVSLTSTTYGSLLLIDRPKPHLAGRDRDRNRSSKPHAQPPPVETKKAKPVDPEPTLSPDSVINTWELMDGLDDDLDFDSDKPAAKPIPTPAKPTSENVFDGWVKKKLSKMDEDISSLPPWSPKKPLWKHISEESFLAKLDPNVASTYIRALSSRQLCSDQPNKTATTTLESSRRSSSFSNHWPNLGCTQDRRIVIYFTSLRGIRKTYEDCCLVRMIFRGFRVAVDERDISMDSFFRKELQAKLGGKAPASLPQVFIGGKHVGGAEEIKQMNEGGELGGMLEGFPVAEVRCVCGRCGDARFVPCPNCNGSRKLFGEEDGELRRCPHCNENGLIRCPFCCCL